MKLDNEVTKVMTLLHSEGMRQGCIALAPPTVDVDSYIRQRSNGDALAFGDLIDAEGRSRVMANPSPPVGPGEWVRAKESDTTTSTKPRQDVLNHYQACRAACPRGRQPVISEAQVTAVCLSGRLSQLLTITNQDHRRPLPTVSAPAVIGDTPFNWLALFRQHRWCGHSRRGDGRRWQRVPGEKWRPQPPHPTKASLF